MRETEEAEHVLMERGLERRVQQKAVAVGTRFVAAVRSLDQNGHRSVLQLVAHFGDRLAVSSTAVVHALTWRNTPFGISLLFSFNLILILFASSSTPFYCYFSCFEV